MNAAFGRYAVQSGEPGGNPAEESDAALIQKLLNGENVFPNLHRSHNHAPAVVTAYQPIAETKVSDTTLADATYLFIEVGPRETWDIKMFVSWTQESGAGDLKFDFRGPVGTTFRYLYSHAGGNTAESTIDDDQTLLMAAAGTEHFLVMGSLVTGDIGGRFYFRWSQNASSVDDVTLNAGSHIIGIRLS